MVLGIPVIQLAQGLIVPAAAVFATEGLFMLGLFGVIAVVGLVARVLSWQRRTFSFDGEVVRVDSGVLSRSHRSLDVARIQQVEIHRGPVQRVFGLASLRIETAGSASEPEVDLRVLPEADAVALRAAVRVSKARADGKPVRTRADGDTDDIDATGLDEGRPVLRVPMKHVVISSVTGARLLVLPAIIGGALQFIGQQMGTVIDGTVGFITTQGTELVERPSWPLIALSALAILLVTLVAAIAVGVVRDGNFRIERIDDDLHISRGLISTRESVVPLRRVQLVEVQRNWLRRLLGYAVVRVRSAGGSTGGDGRVTVPLLPEQDVDGLLGEILPGVPGVPELTAHPRQALRRGLYRWLRPPAALAVLVWGLPALFSVLDVPIVGGLRIAVLVLLPLSVVLAFVEHRHLGHGLTERVLAARQGALSITTTIAPVVKVQAVSSRANFFQRRLGLTTLTGHVAGPAAVAEVLDAHHLDAARLHERLTDHAASPIPLHADASDPDATDADPSDPDPSNADATS